MFRELFEGMVNIQEVRKRRIDPKRSTKDFVEFMGELLVSRVGLMDRSVINREARINIKTFDVKMIQLDTQSNYPKEVTRQYKNMESAKESSLIFVNF